MMKRKSSSNREAMDFMEFSREATRLLREAQCLRSGKTGHVIYQSPLFWGGRGHTTWSLTAWLWRSAGDVRSGRQRYQGATWWQAPPGWSPWCRRTPRNSRSDWTGTRSRPAAPSYTSSQASPGWTLPGELCWQPLRGEAERQSLSHVGGPGGTWLWVLWAGGSERDQPWTSVSQSGWL